MLTAETLTEDEKDRLKGLIEVLTLMTKDRPNIPVHQLILLFMLALDEGQSQKHYREKSGFPPSTVSRAMLDLGQKMRSGEPGLGLIDDRTSAHSLREYEMYLSRKGAALVKKIAKILGR